jgi:hypothetical protein
MRRVKQISGGGYTVDFNMNTMYIEQEFMPNTFMADVVKSAAGTDIVYYAEDHSPEITLDSRQYSIVDDNGREAIIEMYNAPDLTYSITYNDNTTQSVMFRLDKPPDFAKYSLDDCLYTAKIYLTRI